MPDFFHYTVNVVLDLYLRLPARFGYIQFFSFFMSNYLHKKAWKQPSRREKCADWTYGKFYDLFYPDFPRYLDISDKFFSIWKIDGPQERFCEEMLLFCEEIRHKKQLFDYISKL